MLDVLVKIKNNYGILLIQRGIQNHNHNFYQKWLRFSLDFCQKHNHNGDNQDSLTHIIKKLQEKKQNSYQDLPPICHLGVWDFISIFKLNSFSV